MDRIPSIFCMLFCLLWVIPVASRMLGTIISGVVDIIDITKDITKQKEDN